MLSHNLPLGFEPPLAHLEPSELVLPPLVRLMIACACEYEALWETANRICDRYLSTAQN